MNKLLWSFLLILSCIYLNAQDNNINIKILSKTNSLPLSGASVYIESLKKGSITDFDGMVNFTKIPNGKYEILISYVGFQTLIENIDLKDSVSLTYYLEEGNELDVITLNSTRSTRTIKKIPTRIEFISEEELGEKAIMNASNISMVLRESTGIQMQQTSLSSGNTNIKIQGLDGRYTQLLKDGFPLYGGFSSGLSILQIPPLDLQQFEIIKGSSSTLYGGGAIAGLVDMVSKTPKEDADLNIMFSQTHALGSTGNVFYSNRNDKFGVTLYGSGHYQKVYDPEDDDFSNLPLTKSVSINPKLFYYPSEKTTVWLGINGTFDDRTGGDVNAIENDVNGIHQFTEHNLSKRWSTQAVYKTQLDSTSALNIKNSFAFFDRKLTLPNFIFEGDQINSFTEITYSKNSKKIDLIFGTNLYTTNFDEVNTSVLQRDQKDITFGFFANSTYDISENWILETGFRTDYAKDWGFFPLPKISLLYKNLNGFSSRIGGGLGYKIPDIFTEDAEVLNFNNVLPIDKDELVAERSFGVNLDFNYKTHLTDEIGFSVNQLFYITSIKNGLLLNNNTINFYAFENANDIILSKGAETNIKFTYKDFKWFLNYAFIDTQLNYLAGNPQKPLTAKHNAGSVIMYESEKWRIGFETYYTGKQLFNNGNKTTDFVLMGLLVMKNFKWGSIYVNFENFTDQRQSKFSTLTLPPHENPVFSEIYAPTDGFIFSTGIILKPFNN